MSKPINDLKKRMKAPRDLKEAVKKGERLTHIYYADTPATNARKFALAFAGYACVAALLLGSVIVLPSLLSAKAPVAQSGTSEKHMLQNNRVERPRTEEDDSHIKTHVVENQQPDEVVDVIRANTEGLANAPEEPYTPGVLNTPVSQMDDSKKATVIAKKVSSVSYYHIFVDEDLAPAAYTLSTYEIIEVEKNSDFYYSLKETDSPYRVGNTIQVFEWYAFIPTESNPNEYTLYCSYPYSYSGVEVPDPVKIGETCRLSLVSGSALDHYDDYAGVVTYDTTYEPSRSGVFHLIPCYLIADLEKIG